MARQMIFPRNRIGPTAFASDSSKNMGCSITYSSCSFDRKRSFRQLIRQAVLNFAPARRGLRGSGQTARRLQLDAPGRRPLFRAPSTRRLYIMIHCEIKRTYPAMTPARGLASAAVAHARGALRRCADRFGPEALRRSPGALRSLCARRKSVRLCVRRRRRKTRARLCAGSEENFSKDAPRFCSDGFIFLKKFLFFLT